MGNSIAPPPIDFRVERAMKVFKLPEEKVVILWRIFVAHDKDKRGTLLFQDFWREIVDYPRNPFTDNISGLIETKNESQMNFGEFVELVCTLANFEDTELLKYLFYILDPRRLGVIDVNEFKHLLLNIHDHNRGLIREAIEKLELEASGDNHTYNFGELQTFRKDYPFSLYPLFRLQTQVQENTLSVYWWENHKAAQSEIKEEARQKEIARQERLKKEAEQEDALATEEVLKKRMGIKYYLMPWARAAEERKLMRIAAIEKQMDAKRKEIK